MGCEIWEKRLTKKLKLSIYTEDKGSLPVTRALNTTHLHIKQCISWNLFTNSVKALFWCKSSSLLET